MASHHHHHTSEVLLPPAYSSSTALVSSGEPYYEEHGAYAAPHHHHLYVPSHAPPRDAPYVAGGMQTTPGVYVEQAFESPLSLPTSWSDIEASSELHAACVAVVTDAGYAFSSDPWVCRAGVLLVRAVLAGSPTKYLFVRQTPGSDEEVVGGLAYTAETLPLPSTHVLSTGFYDNITTDGKRGWGFSVFPSVPSIQADESGGVFRRPSVCFVLGGTEATTRVLTRSVRVVGTPKTAGLSVEIVGLIPNDDGGGAVVSGTVGKDLYLGALQPPCIVRVNGMPADKEYGLQGVELTLSSH